LVIRRFRIEDASTLAAYRSDPAIAEYQSWDTPFSHAQARSFIEALQDANPDTPGEWFQFAVVEAATGVHIGDVAAGIDADDPRLTTIGVTLATSAQGQGYAGEAVAWLLDYLFLERQKHRVTADCDVRNSRVVALFDHLRMRREGHHLQSLVEGRVGRRVRVRPPCSRVAGATGAGLRHPDPRWSLPSRTRSFGHDPWPVRPHCRWVQAGVRCVS
jgi:RimJ/RimL family protein N-acetyltransferase